MGGKWLIDQERNRERAGHKHRRSAWQVRLLPPFPLSTSTVPSASFGHSLAPPTCLYSGTGEKWRKLREGGHAAAMGNKRRTLSGWDRRAPGRASRLSTRYLVAALEIEPRGRRMCTPALIDVDGEALC